jgi:hypothetical protein
VTFPLSWRHPLSKENTPGGVVDVLRWGMVQCSLSRYNRPSVVCAYDIFGRRRPLCTPSWVQEPNLGPEVETG